MLHVPRYVKKRVYRGTKLARLVFRLFALVEGCPVRSGYPPHRAARRAVHYTHQLPPRHEEVFKPIILT
jgi:hypothetical protein